MFSFISNDTKQSSATTAAPAHSGYKYNFSFNFFGDNVDLAFVNQNKTEPVAPKRPYKFI